VFCDVDTDTYVTGQVPEDTFCPLDTLVIMFKAVEGGSSVSILRIRKWLKVLLDRSLMLGSIDRPQLHDLVLDFVIGMYTEQELKIAHRRVVDAFRENRTISPAGIVGWSKANRGDAATMYVCNEVGHHIGAAAASNAGAGYDEAVLRKWLLDTPADCITWTAAELLGVEQLTTLGEQSHSAGEFWVAACHWALAAHVKMEEGSMAQVPQLRAKALAALWRIEDGEMSQHSRIDRQALEINMIRGFYMTGGKSEMEDFEATAVKPQLETVLRYEALDRMAASDRFVIQNIKMVRGPTS
jgi:hypothetical protein